MKKNFLLLLLLASFSSSIATANGQSGRIYDVVIYGGTSAAVSAAVQARMGKTVVIVWPDKHLGGLSSGGLGFTDTGNKAVIGGLAREFYHRVWQHYDQPEAWKWQKREGVRQQGPGHAGDRRRRADDVDLRAARRRARSSRISSGRIEIPVVRDEWLDREQRA